MNKANIRLRVPTMTPTVRYVWAIVAIVISLHYILSFTHEAYGQNTSMSNILGLGAGQNETDSESEVAVINVTAAVIPDGPIILPQVGTANATIVFLCRNSDLEGVVSSVRQLEDRFNRKFNYPWVFLNDEPFTEEFKKRVRILTYAKMEFGLIPKEHWNQPDWIDEEKATASRESMQAKNIIYAGSVPYRNMCRFNSGFFYKHELLQPYRYYWRVEPSVQFFCDIDYDPFTFMQENNKTYGFTLSMVEYVETVPTLWSATKEFITENPQYLAESNSMRFLSDNFGSTYNLCHFWSNFEIADMNFWRGEAYQAYFDHLDSKGGFYYERWGDAPVHSIAAALFANKDQLHFFKDIGYRHDSFQHCPQGDAWSGGKCSCDPSDTFDYTYHSCLKKYERVFW